MNEKRDDLKRFFETMGKMPYWPEMETYEYLLKWNNWVKSVRDLCEELKHGIHLTLKDDSD